MTVVFMFPGQNSRYPSMIAKLIEADPTLTTILDQASQVLGRDLLAHYVSDNKKAFARNRDVQIGVFLANFLWGELLRRRGVTAEFSVGLSLGEYNHLVDIGALGFDQALRLLEARGIAFGNSADGAMAAVFPMSEDDALAIVDRLGAKDRLAVAMRNAPQQQVFSGARKAVDDACAIAEDEHFIQPVVIESRLPMHSPLFRSVADEFQAALEAVRWNRSTRPYLPNSTADLMARPTGADIQSRLSEHLYQPVLWKKSIDRLCAEIEDAVFVEVGPRTVLSDMLRRRWVKRPIMATDGDSPVLSQLEKIRKLCLPCSQTS